MGYCGSLSWFIVGRLGHGLFVGRLNDLSWGTLEKVHESCLLGGIYCILFYGEVDEWMKDILVGLCLCRRDSFAVQFPLRCIAKLHSTVSVFLYLIYSILFSFVFFVPCS